MLCNNSLLHPRCCRSSPTSGEEHVIPKEGIKGVVSSITVVDDETVEIDEVVYYLLLALVNRSTGTTFPDEADKEPFAESADEQGDDDSNTCMHMNAGQPQRKRKRTVNQDILFYSNLTCSFSGI